jgi:uncharacterized membrane protein YkvA (DUF1232 family)
MMEGLRQWARALKRNVMLLWLAARDPRTPFAAKLLAGCVAAYALSPIDLIPDFIPVIGLLDDLLLVPAGIWLALRLIPPGLRDELREAARDKPWPGPALSGAVAVGVIWLAAAALIAAFALPRFVR